MYIPVSNIGLQHAQLIVFFVGMIIFGSKGKRDIICGKSKTDLSTGSRPRIAVIKKVMEARDHSQIVQGKSLGSLYN